MNPSLCQFPDQPCLNRSKEKFPFFRSFAAPSTCSRIHLIFVPEKYASMISPVFFRIISVSPRSFKESQYSAVLLHCHTIAGQIGSPVSLSQTTTVSLWFVIPIATISSASAPTLLIASTATPSCVDQISEASCSTQPGCGKYCVNSFCARLTISPFSLNRIQRLLGQRDGRANLSGNRMAVQKNSGIL